MRQMRPLKITLTASLLALAAASYSPVLANAGPAPSGVPPCCDDNASRIDTLDGKVKFLEDHAVKAFEIYEMRLSGWANRAVQWADNGFHSNTSYTTPANLTSFIQFDGKGRVAPGLTFGAFLGVSYGSNGTVGPIAGGALTDIHRSQSQAEAVRNIFLTRSEVTIDSFKWGRINLGRGAMAGSGIIFGTDLSFTFTMLHPFTTMGGMAFRYKNAPRPNPAANYNPISPNSRIGSVFVPQRFNNPVATNPYGGSTLVPGATIFNPGDGTNLTSQADRIMYTTPVIVDQESWFNGMSLAVAHGYQHIGDLFDVAYKWTNLFRIPWANTKTIISMGASWSRNHTQEPGEGYTVAQNFPILFANSQQFNGQAAGANPFAPLLPAPVNIAPPLPAGVLPELLATYQYNPFNYRGPKFDTMNAAFGILLPFSMSGKIGTGINTQFTWVKRKWRLVNNLPQNILDFTNSPTPGVPGSGRNPGTKQKDGQVLAGKLGYTDKFFGVGNTHFITNYGQWTAMALDPLTNLPATGSGTFGVTTGGPTHLVGTNWGVGIQQDVDAAGSWLYLRYDNMSLKRKGRGQNDKFKPVQIVYSGLTVRF